MMTTKDLLDEALSLPVEQRVLIADRILRSLNAPDPDAEAEWLDLARSRRAELQTGSVESIPVSDIFDRVKTRFSS
ncbi:MAG: addiction module protein [Planctomycetota bacterium]|jgi:hypothetical protein